MPSKFVLTDTERRARIRELRGLISAADHQSDVRALFLPLPVHALALRRECVVVRGERGAGKTALFRFIQTFAANPSELDPLLPGGAKLEKVRWVEGFSEGPQHPLTNVIDQFVGEGGDLERLRTFWITHLVCILAENLHSWEEVPSEVRSAWQESRNEPGVWVGAAWQRLGSLAAWLDRLEGRLAERSETLYVTYDHLDRIGQFTPGVSGRASAALLALWLSLINRYRWLRAKIFLREDLFEASQHAFPDANKLKGLSVSLEWTVEDLFRLLVRHMANLSGGMRDWLTCRSRPIPLTDSPLLGYLPPDHLPEEASPGKPSQHKLISHLVSERIGSGGSKGYTHRWIPNRLQDGHGRIVPRSILNLFQHAAELADSHGPKGTHDRLFDARELMEALPETSSNRVKELEQEHRVVARMEALRGMGVMMDRDEVTRRLAAEIREDGYGSNGPAVVGELLRLGVLKERPDSRIDVPDIYRYAWDIRRRGVAAKPK